MVSELDSGSSGPGSSLGRGHCVVSLGQDARRKTVRLSIQAYKWVPANLMLGYPCDGLGGSKQYS